MILHNLCIDHRIRNKELDGDVPRSTSVSDCVDFCEDTKEKYPKAFVMSREQREGRPGRRRDLEYSHRRESAADWALEKGKERDELADWLEEAGLVRPGRRTF